MATYSTPARRHVSRGIAGRREAGGQEMRKHRKPLPDEFSTLGLWQLEHEGKP